MLLLGCVPVLLLAAAQNAAPPEVPATRVKSERIAKPLRVTGDLQAFRSVALYPKIPGFVEWIGVDRGSKVKAGEALVRLVAPEIAAQKQEAEARLAADEASHARLMKAAETPGVVAGNDLELAARAVEGSRARVRILTEQESYLHLKAPFGGVITERQLHEGAFAGPPSGAGGVPVLRLQEVSRLRLVVHVPEHAAGDLPLGKKLRFSVSAHPGADFEGVLARSASALDARTRSLSVEADVDNADGRLAPGMFAAVAWVLERPQPSLLVPLSAIVTTTEKSFVIRIRDGRTEWVDARQGLILRDWVEIFADLAEGDVVVLRGTDELRPGLRVSAKIVP
jgi:membrane fusion protein (multidrug efflux system)